MWRWGRTNLLNDKLKIVEQANTSTSIPKTNTKYDEAIVDTGTTSHYLTKDTPVINNAQENKIQVTLPDGNKLSSIHTTALPMEALPTNARNAHIVDGCNTI